MNQERKWKEKPGSGTYQIIALPILFSLVATVFPNPSSLVGIYSTTYCLILFISTFISNKRKWHYNKRFRLVFGLIQIDVTTILGAVFVTRMLNGSLGFLFLLIVLLILTVLIGHLYRRKIISELKNPQTVLGKILASFGLIGGGLAGILTYWASQSMSGIIVGSFIYALLLLVVAIAHAQWPIDNE